jgi:general secretion pathway protein F
MNWSYLAYDARGSRILGTVAAESADAAADLLRQKGLFIVSVAAARGDAAAGSGGSAGGRRRRGKAGSTRDVAVWAREMLILVRAGTPVAQALAAIESQQADGPWRDVLSDIRSRVES